MLVIPDKIEGKSVEKIGDRAFADCSSLASVIIPEGVKEIGDSAFEECCSLTSVVLPESLKKIGDYAFWGCSSLGYISFGERLVSECEWGWNDVLPHEYFL